jgi:DNA-binding MarR family transcriptional regulator
VGARRLEHPGGDLLAPASGPRAAEDDADAEFEMRVGELSESLDWEKSRVSHQLTRMENRGLVEPIQSGAGGRRTGIRLTADGRRAAQSAILGHAGNIRRYFFDSVTPEQTAAIRAWSEQVVDRIEPRCGEAAGDGASQKS